MRRGPSDVEVTAARLLATAGIEINGSRPWDPQVNDSRLWRRVIRDGELGLGEAYQEGWFEVEQLDEMLVRILLTDLRSELRMSPTLLRIAAQQVFTNRQTIARASDNASAHYDIGNDLYERMLDKRMIYSCAYWADAEDLNAAQTAKLELICQKMQIEAGMRVLDVGCGWGGLSHYMASVHGAHVTGISPAIEQVRAARARCQGLPVSIEQTDYRDVTGTYDRIVSVGMMEHVGTKNLGTFFESLEPLLADDGMMLHHTIGANDSDNRSNAWFDKYIFPGGVLPSLAQIADASSPSLTIEDVHNFGPDYDRTLMQWSTNIEAAWHELPSYDETFRRMWHFYLMSSAAGFRTRNVQLWQVVFSRTRTRSSTYKGVR